MQGIFSKFYNFFFLILILFYNIFPKKIRPFIMLLVSLLFFYFLSFKLIAWLLISIISIYLSALIISYIDKKKKLKLENANFDEKKQIKKLFQIRKKIILILCILLNFSFLFVFKYMKFFAINLNTVFNMMNIDYSFRVIKLAAPIGISFYTLQGLSYLFDVYNGKIEADKNPFRVALFISFFPQIVEGPIARYNDTAKSLYEGNKITYQNFCIGMQRILWGIFKKVVIADRFNILVKTIFNDYSLYSGSICFLGALAYTIMLYMEFSSTMDIVIGTGKIFDIKIPENFRQPFFSKSISEFWTRWHISLGLWFKDYVYYPISLSKSLKKLTVKARKIVGNYYGPLISGTIALFVVWLLNGLWHGAGWTFLLFGMYHFILIFLGNLFEPFIQKLLLKIKINRENTIYRIFRSIKVGILVVIGELIFRAPSLSVVVGMLKKIIFNFKFDRIDKLGLDMPDYLVLIISIIVVFFVSLLKEKNIDVLNELNKKKIVIRWTILLLLIFSIIIFGAYGSGYQPVDPIYADF